MARYVALLRGVSPMNAKMHELEAAFRAAGFTDVRTVLSSGNVVFSSRQASEAALARKAEAGLKSLLDKGFPAIIRPISAIEALLATDPYCTEKLPAGAKRVVTFLRDEPVPAPELPVERDGARIVGLHGREAFTYYVPLRGNPVFMTLLEKTFGKDVTTRTWETLGKIVRASSTVA